jgi:tetratricopeptide (TPR) repeat protein
MSEFKRQQFKQFQEDLDLCKEEYNAISEKLRTNTDAANDIRLKRQQKQKEKECYDLEQKLEQLEAELHINQDDSQALFQLGLETQDEMKQIDYFSQAILLNPKHGEAYYRRGIAYYILDLFSSAKSDWQQSLKLLQDISIQHHIHAMEFIIDKKFDRAISFCTSAIQAKNDSPEVYLTRGYAYRNIGRLTEALNDYNTALQINPHLARGYNNRGMLYKRKNMIDEALNDLNFAIQIRDDYAFAYYNRGSVYENLNDFEKAEVDYRIALQVRPGYLKAENAIARIAKRK